MNNLYFLESDNNLLIDLKIKEILKKLNKNIDIINYDMEEVNISNVIQELDTYGFFQEEKIVHAKNANFLGTGKCDIEHDIKSLTKYLENPNTNNILFISCIKSDGKKNIVKLIKEKCTIVPINIDLKDYIKEKCKGYQISDASINYLLDNTGNDISRITNELDKLLSYCIDEKIISNDSIDKVVLKKIDTNIFDLIDAIINKDKKKSLMIYEEMINYGEDTFKILIALANQIRLIYQVKVLQSYSDDEIANILKLKNPKQVIALRYKINKYSESDLINYLYRLSIIDEELKMGKAIDTIIFPSFIASL